MLYSNSNEICSLIESTSGWSVTSLEGLDDPEGPAALLLFDTLFHELPEGGWTVRQVLEKGLEWEQQILPLLKRAILSVHQGVVCDVLRQGVGQDLVSTFPVFTHDFGGTRLPFEHPVFDLHDVARNPETDRTCHLRSQRPR